MKKSKCSKLHLSYQSLVAPLTARSGVLDFPEPDEPITVVGSCRLPFVSKNSTWLWGHQGLGFRVLGFRV